MRQFTEAITESLVSENWYAALFMALTMPDICRSLEDSNPERKLERGELGRLYGAWFDRYLSDKYSSGSFEETRFYGKDCWSYRCKCLHQGIDAEDQKRLKKFVFSPPPNVGRGEIHRNFINDRLQLQIDIFCIDMVVAVERWLRDVEGDTAIQQRINSLLKIDAQHYQ